MNSHQRRHQRRHDPRYFSIETIIKKIKKGLGFYEIFGDDPRDCDFYRWPMILRKIEKH